MVHIINTENIMELSENTLSVLRNYSGINQNILIKEGNTLRTISEARNVLARATVSESFPKDFGIYDLNEFIGVLGLVDKPNLSFQDEYVLITDTSGRTQIKYFYSSEDILTTPQKDITMPEANVSFVLDSATLDKVKRAATALGHNEVSITNNEGCVRIGVIDSKNATSNGFYIDVDAEFEESAVFNFILDIGNIKIIPGDYQVNISSKLISQFINKEGDVNYWIALEKTSTFGV